MSSSPQRSPAATTPQDESSMTYAQDNSSSSSVPNTSPAQTKPKTSIYPVDRNCWLPVHLQKQQKLAQHAAQEPATGNIDAKPSLPQNDTN